VPWPAQRPTLRVPKQASWRVSWNRAAEARRRSGGQPSAQCLALPVVFWLARCIGRRIGNKSRWTESLSCASSPARVAFRLVWRCRS